MPPGRKPRQSRKIFIYSGNIRATIIAPSRKWALRTTSKAAKQGCKGRLLSFVESLAIMATAKEFGMKKQFGNKWLEGWMRTMQPYLDAETRPHIIKKMLQDTARARFAKNPGAYEFYAQAWNELEREFIKTH